MQWKDTRKGKTAILVERARRVGKSTLVEQFAKNEYTSYILVDFNKASKRVVSLFDDLMDLDFIFLQLQAIYNVNLIARDSVIIFDEVQACPKARQAIKYLVADGRYDYIETGSLISINKNTKDITIPSEEERVTFYYSWAKDATHNYEIDFLLSSGAKICPIEVKSSGYKTHASLDAFCEKFSKNVGNRYLLYTKDLAKDGNTLLLPLYMTSFVKIEKYQ